MAAEISNKLRLSGWPIWEEDVESAKAAFERVRTSGHTTEEGAKNISPSAGRSSPGWRRRSSRFPASELGRRRSGNSSIRPLREYPVRPDQAPRSRGQTIPHEEKLFSVFEFFARRLSKGEPGSIAEFGAPGSVRLSRDIDGDWKGTEKECAIPMAAGAGKVPRASSGELRSQLPQLPEPGRIRRTAPARRSSEERPLERGRTGARDGAGIEKMKIWHPGVETCMAITSGGA